jgi:hypothetical protein
MLCGHTGFVNRQVDSLDHQDPPRRDIVAGARYYVQRGGESCELAIAVVDDGRAESLEAGRRALARRGRLNGAASTGLTRSRWKTTARARARPRIDAFGRAHAEPS